MIHLYKNPSEIVLSVNMNTSDICIMPSSNTSSTFNIKFSASNQLDTFSLLYEPQFLDSLISHTYMYKLTPEPDFMESTRKYHTDIFLNPDQALLRLHPNCEIFEGSGVPFQTWHLHRKFWTLFSFYILQVSLADF